MSKKSKIIIGILIVLATITVIYFVFFKDTNTATTTDANADPKKDPSKPIKTKNNIVSAIINTVKGDPEPSDDSFPLKPGSTGDNVRYLQTALNYIRPKNNLKVNSVFDADTKQALSLSVASSMSVLPLSETTFDQIIALGNKAKLPSGMAVVKQPNTGG